MRLWFCVSMILWVLAASCEMVEWEESVITNNSSFPVTFEFNHTKKMNLAIGAHTSFATEVYQRIVYYSPDKMVRFTYTATDSGYTGQFENRQSWVIKVTNMCGELVTLSAEGWMADMEVDAGAVNVPGEIYTDNPNFSAVIKASGFPAAVSYIKPETEPVEYRVTIR